MKHIYAKMEETTVIDKEKVEGAAGKAADFLNEHGEKLKDFAEEHELDQKVESAAHTLEEGAMDIFNSIKRSFN